ncbi:hypothetical protein PGH26_01075 [Sporosarcina jeotgali]|uniref:HTH cro/C1-type domain-containing protein n=1 Tax=Sporosarcina jeotgali TaxID=3020056 RepID=A0ABZ0L041_9BACL|nr:hypothetical protein [Sporosarcina sp. B2O-1]WOV84544.1 hypothetical protein PGH26_01075 [Sporosarcina sp. B2O-1]
MDVKHTALLLNQWMEENQMTNTKMAQLMDVSEVLLQGLLKGDRRMTSKRLTQFAEITNIPRASLLGLSDKVLFAGYSIIPHGGTELSTANKHQIQQIALLLNEYESFK